MDIDRLVPPEVAERWRRVEAGADLIRRLEAGHLEPGQVGVLEVEVRTVSPIRPYQRKRGGTGTMGRVTLADGTGEVDMVLWDDELQAVKSGPFRPGVRLRIQGPNVRAGFRGGVELSLGSAVVTVVDAARDSLAGLVVRLEEVRRVEGGRRNAQLVLDTPRGQASVTLWEAVVDGVADIPAGTRVVIDAVVEHPSLPGHWLTTPRSTLLRV